MRQEKIIAKKDKTSFRRYFVNFVSILFVANYAIFSLRFVFRATELARAKEQLAPADKNAD